jgi:TM2 domain-containing membrane protein YozV
MKEQDITTFLISTNDLFPQETIPAIKKRLTENDDNIELIQIAALDYKKPVIALVLGITLGPFGADRFYIGDIGLGIAKLCTCGGLYLWWLIDMFLIMGETRKKNYYLLMNTLNTLGNSSINTDTTNESAEDQPILEDNVPDNQ